MHCPKCDEANNNDSSALPSRKPATEYSAPSCEIYDKDTVYENPNKAYDNKASEFYRPHKLPHSHRRGNKKRRRSRRRTRMLKVSSIIIAVLLTLSIVLLSIELSNSKAAVADIMGKWTVETEDAWSAGYTYTFSDDGFVFIKNPILGNDETLASYCWKVEGNRLIVDTTTYHWSSNLDNFSSSKYEYWYCDDTRLYISNTDNNGYIVLVKN